MLRTNLKGLYRVVGTVGYTSYDSKGVISGGGSDGEKEHFFLSENIDNVITRVNNMYNSTTIKEGTVSHFNIRLIEELDYSTISEINE